MPQQNSSAKEQLLKLEKLLKKIIRKSLKNNTLDYTAQITVSSLEPGKLKYAAHISSPSREVQDITYVYDNFSQLETMLEESLKSFNPQKVEVAFHESRINSYKAKILQHEARVKVLQDPNFDPETDGMSDMEKKNEKSD